jgi:hypothetical protein
MMSDPLAEPISDSDSLPTGLLVFRLVPLDGWRMLGRRASRRVVDEIPSSVLTGQAALQKVGDVASAGDPMVGLTPTS